MTGDSKLSIWAVSDGRAGIENQALGLAEAVSRLVPAEIAVKRVAWKGPLGRLPTPLLARLPPSLLASPLRPPWPDLWIAAGRATLPLSIRMRREQGARPFVVQLQDPQLPPDLFDLVIPPRHDGLTGANVFPILGSPHRVTPERLASEAAKFADRLGRLPGLKAAILIGGRSRHFDLTPDDAESLAARIEAALEPAEASILMTFSRRTPDAAKRILAARLGGRPGMVWDGTGENPYFAFLEAADVVLVTEDSINMAAEAAATGKSVLVLPMRGGSPRIRRFHEELEVRGASRPFETSLLRWPYEPLRETERAASEVLRRLGVGRG